MPDLINKFIEGGTTGTSHTAGLPNITGNVNAYAGSGSNGRACFREAYGAFSLSNSFSYPVSGSTSSSTTYGTASFDASTSNSIYGNSTTVQPNSLEMTYCIKY